MAKKKNKIFHKNHNKKRKKYSALSNKFLSSEAWRALRYDVLKERGPKCECCGATPASGAVIHVDHIKPRYRFPHLALVKDNLQVLCEDCNFGKGARDYTDWRQQEELYKEYKNIMDNS